MSEQDAADADAEPAADESGDAATENGDEDDDHGGTETAENGVAVEDSEEAVDEELGDDAVDESLLERVVESDPESVAHELAALRTRVEGLEDQLEAREEELDDVTAKLKRKQADFQNYKKRMERRREQEKRRATEDLVERLVEVRDNLVRALDQDDADAEDITRGVETTLSQFDRVLADENVEVVDPEPGEEVDPHTHEVLMRVESDQPEGTVDDVHRPGYLMADKVIQTAQVTVSDGE
ncbi:MAG: nucleotide exchange factor GrpE [Haloarculaceae archaeon]